LPINELITKSDKIIVDGVMRARGDLNKLEWRQLRRIS